MSLPSTAPRSHTLAFDHSVHHWLGAAELAPPSHTLWGPLGSPNTCCLAQSTHGGCQSQHHPCAPLPHGGRTLPFGPVAPHWWHQSEVVPHGLTSWAPPGLPDTYWLGQTTHGGHKSQQCLCAPLPPSGHTLLFGPHARHWWHQAEVAPHGLTPWVPLGLPDTCWVA